MGLFGIIVPAEIAGLIQAISSLSEVIVDLVGPETVIFIVEILKAGERQGGAPEDGFIKLLYGGDFLVGDLNHLIIKQICF